MSFRKKKKDKKQRRKLSLTKKIILSLAGAAACAGAVYLSYYFIRYVGYGKYREYLTSYAVEEGSVFSPIAESRADVEGLALAAENDVLKLYADAATGEVAVYDKRNGVTVRSNPVGGGEDPIANVTNRSYLRSQFVLNYYNQNVRAGIYDSYSMCVEKGQLSVEGLADGLRFLYDVGDYSGNATGIVPIYILPEKLEEVASRLEESSAAAWKRYYIESKTAPGMLELNGVAQKNVKTIQKIQGWLDEIGWTQEEFEEQAYLAGVEGAVPISFTVPLEYRLREDALEVSVPVSLIEERGGGKLYWIQLLQFMGAADTQEDGYLVTPNGSGSLIYFNNGKTQAANYSQYVYGIDPLLANYTTLENTEDAKLPLYGICRKDSSLLATIEQGSSLANLTAGISGVYHGYNYCYPTFVVRSADNLLSFGESASDVSVLEPELYDVNLTVRYTLLIEKYRGYSGLARYYRERLVKEGALAKQEDAGGTIPFYYDIIGGVKETNHFLGVQYLRTFSMTDFEQAGKISEELAAQGIGNQVMNFQGWFNGGYYHDTADRIRVTGKLGGKSGLEELSDRVAAVGGRFYADTAFQKVSWAAEENGYNYEAMDSRYYGLGFTVNFGQVNPVNLRATSGLGYEETGYNILSPKFLPRYVGKFADKIGDYDIDGISLRDLGSSLASDKRRTQIINREQALQVVEGQLKRLADTGKALMVNEGNSYSFSYARDLLNAPTTGSDFFLVDEDIPLYEMILHGYIPYSTKLLNFSDTLRRRESILNMIEYGASPHYVFTWENSSRMKNTGLSRFYATTWETWKTDAIEVYRAVNEALGQVTGAAMEEHEILENGVRKVRYDNGVTIYVNHSALPQEADGILIPAGSWEAVG
ncbi:MAG: DUF5696 domain-containing protein [Clostridium sp.]|jgi:hypothetical protein|nr:DUF5696 domain-containing protein [Clostridium sp.]